MLLLTRNRLRTVATALTAGALAATTLAFASAPAQADDAQAPGTLSWGVSDQFRDHFSPKPYAPASGITASGGATYTNGDAAATFAGVSSVTAAGTTVHTYEGTLQGAFVVGGAEQYAVTIADPVVTVDADGDGSISAVVSARNIASQQGEAAETTPARAIVAEFADATVTDGVLSGTPNWEGVLAANSQQATDLGIAADKPVDGKSFHPAFLTQLTSGTRAHFYASGASSDTKKAPSAFSATATPPAAVTASATVNGDYVDIAIAGTGFDPASRPGAMGVYAAIGPKQDIFAIDAEGEEDGAAAFLTSDWVMPAQFTDGAWSKTLTVEKAKLVKGVQYAVYTWTAHGNPVAGDSQYTETLVSVPGLAKNVGKVKSKVKKAPTTKKAGKLEVTLKGHELVTATGKVKVTLKKGKATKKANGTLNKKGIVKIKLPKLAKGKWKLTVKYAGDANYKSASKTGKVKVKK
ncbi:Ig-like domain repeat protein [Nocardioides daejeonensis]|uniref:Ig-like domain repeat protein n=1 Tax=Nocardioides daejeonensis TaxID=1046556 RepID=UPI000D74031C|nr:Ig-like domain repeat protein [Nocardioides daejeonensis]